LYLIVATCPPLSAPDNGMIVCSPGAPILSLKSTPALKPLPINKRSDDDDDDD